MSDCMLADDYLSKCWHSGVNGKYRCVRKPGKRQSVGAHRHIWEECFGEIPDGLHVCHHCDNPPCINPEHLFLGTRKDNMQDMLMKGRGGYTGLQGVKHHKSKLTEEDVLTIRKIKGRHVDVSKKFGVTPETVSMIRRRITWKHIDA